MTLEGYAVEGGFDRPYEPTTCYMPTIALGRHDGPGDAAGVWDQYREVIGFAPELGFEGVRLTLEWTRIEPHRGSVDDEALGRYVEMVAFANSLGLAVSVVLVDAAWPAWLGLEAWLLPWVAPCVVEHAVRVVAALDGLDVTYVAFADPRSLVSGGFLDATRPPWRRGARADAIAADRQLRSVVAQLRGDSNFGALFSDPRTIVTTGLDAESIARARASIGVREVHVRSLVAGSGPTGGFRGLLERRGDAWTIVASEGLRRVLG